MKRRSFLKTSATLSLPLFLNGIPLFAQGANSLSDIIGDDSDRVLVLIQLQGGNDGLSSLIPLDQYDNLAAVRQNVLVPESSILSIENNLGFHPSMQGMKEVWDDGLMHIVQSVGYPDQNRSHFRSTDIWNSASAADEFISTGWMGRVFDQDYSDYPFGYPNENNPHPFALTVGTIVSETCQGELSNFSLALTDPFNPGTVNLGEEGDAPDNCYGAELTYVREIAKQANAYSEVIVAAANAGNNLSDKYQGADANPLSQKLATVARLISGGLQTKLYIVQIGGFDTHSGQVEAGEPEVGTHAELLQQVSDAVCAFQDDIVQLGLQERVLGMTYSEFGRQIRSNASNGTDHGTAAPMFLFGSCVNPDILGENPEIDTEVGEQEGVPMQYDFRNVYGTVLTDWFQVEEDIVKNLLFDDFQKLPILQLCETTSTSAIDGEILDVQLYPNPVDNYLKLEFEGNNEVIRVSIFNALGSEIKLVSNQTFSSGSHSISVECHDLVPGSYFVRMVTSGAQKTKKFIKQ